MTWSARLTGRLPLVPIAAVLLAAVAAAFLTNLGGEVLKIREGQNVARALTSRVDFQVLNKRKTDELRGVARATADVFYGLDVSLLQDIRGRLTQALQLAKDLSGDPDRLVREAAQIKVLLNEEGRDALLQLAAADDPAELKRAAERYEAWVDAAISRLAARQTPLVEPREASEGVAEQRRPLRAILVDPRPTTAALSGTPQEAAVPVASLQPASREEPIRSIAEAAARAFDPALRTSIQDSLLAMLRGEQEGAFRPIYRYLRERSDQAAQLAYTAVEPQYDRYSRDRLLADSGLISPDELELLRQEHEAYIQWLDATAAAPSTADATLAEANFGPAARRYRYFSRLGYGFLAALVMAGLIGHASQHRGGFRFRIGQQVLIIPLLLATLALTRLLFVTTGSPHYALGAQALAVIAMAIVAPQGPVLAIASAAALLNTLAAREGVSFFLVLLAVSMVLLIGLREIRYRGKIVLIGAGAAVVAVVTTLAAGLVGGQPLAFVFWKQALLAGSVTLAAAFIVEGLLPGVERLFGVSTSMTLLEWCDASRPLLRMLAAEAPGTYNHSLLVGTLANSAAEAVGANGLLARTGSYYHDIGKINKPEYFVENQALGASRHDRLSPAMSLLIIIGHVKDGVEMAHEYGLPASLHPFIREHHGTTLVQYFYHAASQQRRPGDREVSDVEFRYPGPKPQSRETAIVMLCDGVEGAVRSMPEPTPGRIEDVVTRIVRDRLMDGQFDECDLTFRELEVIERSLIKSLCAIYHSRIAYPSPSQPRPKPAETRVS